MFRKNVRRSSPDGGSMAPSHAFPPQSGMQPGLAAVNAGPASSATATWFGLLADFCASVVTISLMHEFIAAVWFLPLNALDLTGYEPILLAYAAGAALGWPAVRRAAETRAGLLRALSTVGLLSFFVVDNQSSHVRRTVLIALGLCFDQVCFFGALLGGRQRRRRLLAGFLLAFVAIFGLRMRHASVYCVWTSTAYCAVAVTMGLAAAVHAAVERHQAGPRAARRSCTSSAVSGVVGSPRRSARGSACCRCCCGADDCTLELLASSSALGATLFMTQFLFATHGIVPRWANVAPFGPPVPAGLGVAAAVMLGASLTVARWPAVRRVPWLAAGTVSAAVFCYCTQRNLEHPWWPALGMTAGLTLGVFVFSLLGPIVEFWAEHSAALRPGLAVGVTMGMYIFETLVAIWVVAYKFCPGGWLLRESQSVLFATVFASYAALYVVWHKRRPGRRQLRAGDDLAMGSDEEEETVGTQAALVPADGVVEGGAGVLQRPFFVALVALLLGLFAPATVYRIRGGSAEPLDNAPAGASQPLLEWQQPASARSPAGLRSAAFPEPTDVSAMIWTVHFGYTNYGRNSLAELSRAIRAQDAKIVGLLETDLTRPFFGNNDLVEYLAADLNYFWDYGSSTAENTWGCALLTAYRIVRAKHLILPSPEGELACLIDAELEVPGWASDSVDDGGAPSSSSSSSLLRVLVTHFGNSEDKLDRALQSMALAKLVGDGPPGQPVVLLSYLTTRPTGPNFKTVTSTGLLDPAPGLMKTPFGARYCEYILYKNLQVHQFRFANATHLSDTEIQFAHFTKLP